MRRLSSNKTHMLLCQPKHLSVDSSTAELAPLLQAAVRGGRGLGRGAAELGAAGRGRGRDPALRGREAAHLGARGVGGGRARGRHPHRGAGVAAAGGRVPLLPRQHRRQQLHPAHPGDTRWVIRHPALIALLHGHLQICTRHSKHLRQFIMSERTRQRGKWLPMLSDSSQSPVSCPGWSARWTSSPGG